MTVLNLCVFPRSSPHLFSYVNKYFSEKKRHHSACHHRQYAGCARRRSPGSAVDDTMLLRPLDRLTAAKAWAAPCSSARPTPGQCAWLPTPAHAPGAPVHERTMLLRLGDTGLWRPRCWQHRPMHGAVARRVVLVHGDGAASPAATTSPAHLRENSTAQ
jgi:hypothetical protein